MNSGETISLSKQSAGPLMETLSGARWTNGLLHWWVFLEKLQL